MKQLLTSLLLLLVSGLAQAFDHSHSTWDALLKRHVVLISDGNASQLDYAGMLADRPKLETYLESLSAVTEAEYRDWSKPQRLAFLINAYNAFTVELILTRYPDIHSIKELGSLFRSPWKQRFFTLLGKERNLDELEHELIRAPGAFDEPRIHFAVNCASVGCPMLRNEAYTAERLDVQLQDNLRRFLSDRSRNRFVSVSKRLQVSKILDWYEEDFEQGHHGIDSLQGLFARYAGLLADSETDRQRIASGDYRLAFLDYDWSLNDLKQ
jgi:hypothetical protein